MTQNVNDPNGLASLFHRNSDPWPDETGGPVQPYAQKTKVFEGALRVPLPKPDEGQVAHLAAARHSCRAFADHAMDVRQLSNLLHAGYGAVGPDAMLDGQHVLRRMVPSAGGLYPLDIYLMVRNVTGLDRGLYHFDAMAGALHVLDRRDWTEEARAAFLTWEFAAKAPVVLCIGATFSRTQTKYGPRGYRFILIETGHVAQNICLAAEEFGLSQLCLGGFHDAVLNRMFGLNSETEGILYSVVVGKS
jgi:SagB-type dehydrogenase family enzyme